MRNTSIPITDDVELDRQKAVNRQMNKWRKQKKPLSYEELIRRIDKYFEVCEELQLIPGIEMLALAIGVSRTTLYRYSLGKGCNTAWYDAITAAKQTIDAAIELAADDGRITPIMAIWRQKQTSGYSDGSSLAALAGGESGEPFTSPRVLAARYEALLEDKSGSTIIDASNIARAMELNEIPDEIPDIPNW